MNSKNDEILLVERVSRSHFQYFLEQQHPVTGLIYDRSRTGAPATITGVGFALTAYGAAVINHWLSRAEAVDYTLRVLRLLWQLPQGEAVSGMSGYRGFFYHFLDPATGLRALPPQFWHSELSSIDTALLMAGVNFCRNFYLKRNEQEREIRRLAGKLYRRVEWSWLVRENGLIGHGWTPEQGLITSVYSGYSEALLLYLLALGSPTFPCPASSWQALCESFTIAAYGKYRFITMPGTPLFCYQFPHCWVDFRGIKDDSGRRFGFDYFENSRRLTLAQNLYARRNPSAFKGYGLDNWGFTASDGPGDESRVIDGREYRFSWYRERGAPCGYDDGTIAPTAALSSLPFAAAVVLQTVRKWLRKQPELFSRTGFCDAFNPTFEPSLPSGWVDSERLAIDQGPVVLMFENHRQDFVWRVMRRDASLRRGLARAGFQGGWLTEPDSLKSKP